MSDLISRADALEAIKWMPVQPDAKTVQRCIEAVSNLPSAEPEPKWIPCSKRLPKAGKNVLISMDDYNVTVGRIVKIGKTKMWQIDLGEYPIKTFVAWMPLPKRYGVEE